MSEDDVLFGKAESDNEEYNTRNQAKETDGDRVVVEEDAASKNDDCDLRKQSGEAEGGNVTTAQRSPASTKSDERRSVPAEDSTSAAHEDDAADSGEHGNGPALVAVSRKSRRPRICPEFFRNKPRASRTDELEALGEAAEERDLLWDYFIFMHARLTKGADFKKRPNESNSGLMQRRLEELLLLTRSWSHSVLPGRLSLADFAERCERVSVSREMIEYRTELIHRYMHTDWKSQVAEARMKLLNTKDTPKPAGSDTVIDQHDAIDDLFWAPYPEVEGQEKMASAVDENIAAPEPPKNNTVLEALKEKRRQLILERKKQRNTSGLTELRKSELRALRSAAIARRKGEGRSCNVSTPEVSNEFSAPSSANSAECTTATLINDVQQHLTENGNLKAAGQGELSEHVTTQFEPEETKEIADYDACLFADTVDATTDAADSCLCDAAAADSVFGKPRLPKHYSLPRL